MGIMLFNGQVDAAVVAAILIASQAQQLSALFDKYVGRMLEWLRVTARPVMYNEQVG